VLREHERAVAQHVELALASGRGGGVEAFVLELGRETRGPCVVAVSGGAVEDLDAHVADVTCRASA
jgi:hypothetical protein